MSSDSVPSAPWRRVKKGELSLLVLALWAALLVWAALTISFSSLDREASADGSTKAATHPRAEAALDLVKETGPIFALLLGATSTAGVFMHSADRKYPQATDPKREPEMPGSAA